jgi:chemotaxis methyl-accepting protein methylase/CheY-like chemotaxis protein
MAADPPGADPLGAPILERLAAELDARYGLALPPSGPAALARRLRHRIAGRALGRLENYAEYLVHGAGEEAWDALAETLTANESRVFTAASDFLPLLEIEAEPRWGRYARGAAGGERFRALSAGSGTGEEAISLAMALAEVALRAPRFEFEVLGVDLSAQAVAAARRGSYSAARFESLPPELRERYLAAEGERLRIGDLRRRMRFARANLAGPDSLRPLGAFDLVLARGVLPALTPGGRVAALANLAEALKPGGVLLLGPGDSTAGADLGLLPVRWGDRHAYERPGPVEPSPLPEEDRAPEPDTALVAHRSRVVRRWLRVLLAGSGYRTEEAADGIEALALATRGRARAVVLLERTLPPDGGPPVAERLLRMRACAPGSVHCLSPRADGTALPLSQADLAPLLPAPDA